MKRSEMTIPLPVVVSRRWWQRKPKRKVMLFDYQDDVKIVEAHCTQAGWIANWWGNPNTISILLPDGTTAGCRLIKKWLPHSGWDGAELGG